MFTRRQPAVETIIGEGSFISGEVTSKGTVRVDGTFEGRIRADWIVIGGSGVLGGTILCRGIVVGGRVEGTIHAGELVDIKSRGRVTGDIYAQRLAISEGGAFEGRSYMSRTKEAESRGVLPFVSER